MIHYKKLVKELRKLKNEDKLNDPKYLNQALVAFSNRIDLLEEYITKNTDTDGTKVGFTKFSTLEAPQRKKRVVGPWG